MEKRIGAMLIVVENKQSVAKLNAVISKYSDVVIGRQGIPLRDKGINIISLVLEGAIDQINALCGQLGRIEGIEVKSILSKNKSTEL